MSDLGNIAVVVSKSVFKLVLAGGISAIAFRRALATGKVPKSVLKNISQLNKDVLLPCFIFYNVASGVTFELLTQLWFVPVMCLLCLLWGNLAGRAAAWLTCAPASQWPVAVTVVTFSNVVGLPLPLLMSLIDGVPQWANSRGSHSRGTSYLFLANIVQSTMMWSLAGPMLAAGQKAQSSRVNEGSDKMLGNGSARSDDLGEPSATPTTVELAMVRAQEDSPPTGGDGAELGQLGLHAAPELDAGGKTGDASGRRSCSSSSTRPVAGARELSEPPGGALHSVRRAGRACHGMLNRPTLASLLGVLVGCTPLRGILSADDAPLRAFLDGMNLIGAGAVPLVILTLGATLSDGPAGAGGQMPRRVVVAVLVAKLLIVPLCALGTLLVALRLRLLPMGDGLLPLAMLILGSSPTAMNISTIATLQGTGAREVASIMFYEYILAIVTVSLVASVGLVLFL